MAKHIRTVETHDPDRMDRWCARMNRLLGIANDCLMTERFTAVRWNKRIKLVLRLKESP